MGTHTAPPIDVTPFRGSRSAELVFSGVDLAGASFEGRVYLNNSGADERTPRTPQEGYAGSFHVYGYGEPAPPAVADAKARAEEDGPVVPIEKRVHVDEAALRAALAESAELTVTVVPVCAEPSGSTPQRPFEQVEVVFEPATTEA